MKKIKPLLIIMSLLSIWKIGFAQKQPSTLTEELKKLNNIAILPDYIEDSEAYMVSSYDRTGGNDDGFSGSHSFIREEGENRFVMADLKGPGVIQRLWTPTPTQDTIQFYFDGEKEPRINMKFEDLFTGNVFPFISPLCGNEIGGYFSYIPIPYAKSLKIVYVGSGLKFHQIQYRNYNKKKEGDIFSDEPNRTGKRSTKQSYTTLAEHWNRVQKPL